MTRLKRYEAHRFIGDRRTMIVYDCDDDGQYEQIASLMQAHDLWEANHLQTFAPDDLSEAANRGFHPRRPPTGSV